jgi:type I restriction enzyme S subunit
VNEKLVKGEQVFPDGWRHVRFGEVATLQRGFDLPVQDRALGSCPVIGSNGIVGFHNEAKVPGPGVVIGRSGTIGKSFSTKGAYWPLNTSLYVKDFHGNNPLFIHFFFHVFEFGKYSAGVSVPTLNRNLVHEATVCIPPLPEQRAVAAVLSKIRAAVEVQEKIVATLKELKAATMAKLFREGLRGQSVHCRETRFGEVPANWNTARLSEYAHVQTGMAKGRQINDSPTIERPYLRVANVQDGYLDLSEVKTIRLRATKLKRYSLRIGDVLLTQGGDFDKLGRGYLWSGQIQDCVHQNHIFAVRTDPTRLLPQFFAYLV